jgi:hypothetical protein
MIRLMVQELTHMQTELTIMETGLMISNMAMEWSLGLMEQNTRDNIEMERKMAKESLLLLMEVIMMESLNRMK